MGRGRGVAGSRGRGVAGSRVRGFAGSRTREVGGDAGSGAADLGRDCGFRLQPEGRGRRESITVKRCPLAARWMSVSERPAGDAGSSGCAAARAVGAAAAPLAVRLVLIHPAVGGREQRFVRFAVVREHRRADADAERQPLARPRLEVHRVDALLQLLRASAPPRPRRSPTARR